MVVPADAIIDQDKHLVPGILLPMLGIDGFRLHAPEEPLRGGVVRRTAFRAHRPRQTVPFHEIQPSGPPVMAAAVDEVVGRGRGLALVGAVAPSSRHVRRQTVLGHDPADHLLRDTGSEHGLDSAVPVPSVCDQIKVSSARW